MRMKSSRLAWLATAVAAGLVAIPPAPLAGAAAADACQSWNGSQPVNPATGNVTSSHLVGTAAVSACDVWAVGYTRALGGKPSERALIEHWTGSSWALTPVSLPDTRSQVAGVSAVSASNVWAVGFIRDPASQLAQPLILHWNGSQWTRAQSPVPPGDSGVFSIDALSATDAWAVGEIGSGSAAIPLALHWDGSRWTQTAFPPPPAGAGEILTSVSGVSGSDVWAQGSDSSGNTRVL